VTAMLPWIVAAVTLIVLLVAFLASARSQRQLRLAHEESIATKSEQISLLETQLASLRESESIRFVDRYVTARKGLEERTANLSKLLESTREEQDKLRDELSDLSLSESERESEKDRLLRDLGRANDQIRRLEMVLREVVNVGMMDVNAIQSELAGRRELATHIHDRLERLSAQAHERQAQHQSRTLKLEQLHNEGAKLRREIEVTRAAASIVDGILGMDSETRKRLARHATSQIQSALDALGDAAGRDPISKFVDILEKQRPERLLERGKQAIEPEPERVQEDIVPPHPADQRVVNRAAEAKRSPDPFFTVLS
jgi:chromosome segregation ATPase